MLEPKLKVDVVARPTDGKVLKGQAVQFDVTVSNLGDGPARNVAIQAKLTAGLRHEGRGKNDEPILYELTLPELLPKQSEKLDPLVADAVVGGEQSCTVKVTSPRRRLRRRKMPRSPRRSRWSSPSSRSGWKGPTIDSPIRSRIIKSSSRTRGRPRREKSASPQPCPRSGKLVGKLPSDARYDSTTRRLSWTIDQLEPTGRRSTFPFISRWAESVVTKSSPRPSVPTVSRTHDIKRTDVKGMPDVDLVVSESKRVLDVGGMTRFSSDCATTEPRKRPTSS